MSEAWYPRNNVWDFNNTELRPYLASYEQYVTCPTRKDNTIDLCYGNIPRVFRSFALPPLLQMFYRAFIGSVLTLSFLGWFGSLSVKNKTVLARVVNVCSKIVGERQASLKELYERRAVRKGRSIAGDSAHVLARH